MDPAPQPAGDLAEEMRKLVENLKQALHSGWESEERKRLQREIQAGLEDAAASLKESAEEFSESPTGQKLKQEFKDFEARVRSGEVETRVREDIVKALQLVNRELEKAAASLRSESPEKPGG